MKHLNESLDKIGNILSEDSEYMDRMDKRNKKIEKIVSSDSVYNKWVDGTDPEILKVMGVTTEALKRATGEERHEMLDKYAEAYDTETGEPWESEGYFGEDSNEDSDEEDTLADPEENIPDREGSGEGGLSDEEIHDKVREYFEKNPKPTDEEIHDYAKELGVEPEIFEAHIYSLLGELLSKDEEGEDSDGDLEEEPKEENQTTEAIEINKANEEQVYELMANVIAVGLAQLEKVLNQEFDSVREAEKFLQEMFRKYRTSGRQYLMQSLRRFDRQGSQRISREFRRNIKV